MGISKVAAKGQADITSQDRDFSDSGQALRYWRGKRSHSQLRLSNDSNISQRHISFLESRRSQPSKVLILKLGTALDIPLRQRNAMLLAAGFAPAFQERKLWNLLMANDPTKMLMRWLLDVPDNVVLPHEGVNLLKLTLDETALRKYIVNGQDVCADLLQWIQREAVSDGPGSKATSLLEELVQLPGIKAAPQTPNLDTRALPFLTMMLKKGGVSLNLFTSITTMGTPQDVTLHELRIENFFPADDATAAWFKSRT